MEYLACISLSTWAGIASIQYGLRGHQEFSDLEKLPCRLIIYVQTPIIRDLFQ